MAVTPKTVLAQWSTLVEGLQWSPKDFYVSVEQALQRRQLPDIFLSRINYAEGGPFSAKREYLRVTRKDHIFDICGAPFGTGFFFSSWLGERPHGCLGILFLIPLLNIFLALFRRETYYKLDTAMMFQESVHNAVLEVIDGLTTAKGIRALSELERKPVMRNFFGR
jgi:hypothetical protein